MQTCHPLPFGGTSCSSAEEEQHLLSSLKSLLDDEECSIGEVRRWAGELMRMFTRPPGWLWDQTLCASVEEARRRLSMALEEKAEIEWRSSSAMESRLAF